MGKKVFKLAAGFCVRLHIIFSPFYFVNSYSLIMKRIIFLLLLFHFSFPLFSQPLSREIRSQDSNFLFIPSAMDTSSLRYIRTLQGTLKIKEEISELYLLLKAEARKLGANCYKLRGFVRNDTSRTMTLTLAVYFADELQRNIIVNNQESNQIYLFSDDKFNKNKSFFRLNGEKVIIRSGSYFKYSLAQEETVKISKGGVAGARFTVNWEEEGPSRFCTIDGFGLNIAPAYAFGLIGALAVSASSGKIREIDYNFGYLLSQILNLQKEKIPSEK